MLRKVFKEELQAFAKNAQECPPKFPVRVCTERRMIQDGVQYTDTMCHACGHKWRVANSYSTNCPVCGCDIRVIEAGRGWRSRTAFVTYEERPECKSVCRYTVEYRRESPGAEISAKPHLVFAAVFKTDEGGACVVDTEKFLDRDTIRGIAGMSKLLGRINFQRPAYINLGDASEKANEVEKKVRALLQEAQINYAPKKGTNKSQKNSLYKEYRMPEISEERILRAIKPLVVHIKQSTMHEESGTYHCHACGTNKDFTFTGMDTYHRNRLLADGCPVCGNTKVFCNISGYSEWYNTVVSVESTDLPNGEIAMRFFMSKLALGDKESALKPTLTPMGTLFVAMPEGKTPISVWVEGTTRKNELKYRISNSLLLQTPDELRQVVEASSLKRAGLLEFFGLGNPAYKAAISPEAMTAKNVIDYITAYMAEPAVEKIAKGNIPAIAKDLLEGRGLANIGHAETLPEILGMSKQAIAHARKHSLGYEDARIYAQLTEMDQSILPEDYAWFVQNFRSRIATIQNINRAYGIPLPKIRQYLETVQLYQCIEVWDALSIWDDYLRMAAKCRFDISDKSRKYPASLKKEHDIAAFAYNRLKSAHNTEMFREQAGLNKRLEYSWNEFLIKVPETPEEVVQEATAQKSCLRSYIDLIQSGETRIVFVRRKEEPDKSFVTIEVNKEDRVVQVKGYANSNPKNEKLRTFLSKWKLAKGLV